MGWGRCKDQLPDGALDCPEGGKKQAQTASTTKARKRANGMGTAYRLKGKRKRPWVAARKGVIVGYYETKTAAMEALAGIQGKIAVERSNTPTAEESALMPSS